MDADQLEEQFNRVLALLPLAKDAGVLEEIATNLDVDIGADAGNKKALQRKIILVLNSDDFDQKADREGQILSARDKMLTHLGFDPGDNNNLRAPVVKTDDD